MSEPDEHPDEPHLTDDAPPPKPGREKAMGFWDHLDELRSTIIKSGLVFIVFAVLIACYLKEFNTVLLKPLTDIKAEYPNVVIELGTVTITEGFSIIVQMCVLGGLALALPFILFFVGQFVSPALTEKELKAVLPLCLSAMVLFLAGAAFSFFILYPSTLRVSIEVNNTFGFVFRWTADSYYTTMMWLTLGVGGSFEFPLLIILLVWLGIMSVEFLRKYRRHAIVVIIVIAALITPTTDPINLMIFAAPLYILYELAIIVASRVEKRRARNLTG